MRKYYLFDIQDEYYKIYEQYPYILYKTLKKLYKTDNLVNGLSLYNRICKIYKVDIVSNYIENKYNCFKKNDFYMIKNIPCVIEVNYATIIIVTKVNFPNIMLMLNIYSHKIFVCDFKNNDYFWLNNYTKVLF